MTTTTTTTHTSVVSSTSHHIRSHTRNHLLLDDKAREDFEKVYNDGNRIYINKLNRHEADYIKPKETMVTFAQLIMPDFGFKTGNMSPYEKMKVPNEIVTCVFTTMTFDPGILEPLIKLKIPLTVFRDRQKCSKGKTLKVEDDKNLNIVYQNKTDFSRFHPKLYLI